MANKEKRPAEMETPTGTCTMTFPDYNMFSGEEQEKAEKIMELIWMGLQTNGMEGRRREVTGCLPTVFGNLWGHTGEIEIDVCKNGWFQGCPGNKMVVHFDERIDQEYDHVRSWLHEILEGMKHDRV